MITTYQFSLILCLGLYVAGCTPSTSPVGDVFTHPSPDSGSTPAITVSPTLNPTAFAQIEPYQTGEVVTVNSGNLLVSTPDRGNIVLYLSPKTDIWEGAWVKDIPIEVGDRITAWGQRRADGSLEVEKLWVNDVNLIGTISDLRQKGEELELTVQDKERGAIVVKIINRRTEMGRPGEKVPFDKETMSLKPGQSVQVIGRQLKDGSVLATDLYP